MIEYDKKVLNLNKISKKDLPYLKTLLENKWFQDWEISDEMDCYTFIINIFLDKKNNICLEYLSYKPYWEDKIIKYVKEDIFDVKEFITNYIPTDVGTEVESFIKNLTKIRL